jgi:cell wall-associated NlpC family hydrolase
VNRKLLLLSVAGSIGAMMLAESWPVAGQNEQPSPASPQVTSTPTEAQEASPAPQPPESAAPPRRALLIEPVRPISPGPRTRQRLKTSPSRVERPKATASAGAAPEKSESRTTQSTNSANEIADYNSYPASTRKTLDLSLSLTNQNLGYKYGSANPANGGMDCSGFVYYVLSTSGISNPPRDAREQYVWVRKAGTFEAVLGHSDDTFELNALKPGDLLFWGGTNTTTREPDIIYTMIYLGRDRETNRRLMIGAADARTFTFNGQPRSGVGVFDFKVARAPSKSGEKVTPIFVGYGHIPNLPNE